jgi:hypothetical protein
MPLSLNIPPGYAQTRTQHDYTKTAQYACPKCGWSGFARMTFKGDPVTPCPHREDSPFEEWR